MLIILFYEIIQAVTIFNEGGLCGIGTESGIHVSYQCREHQANKNRFRHKRQMGHRMLRSTHKVGGEKSIRQMAFTILKELSIHLDCWNQSSIIGAIPNFFLYRIISDIGAFFFKAAWLCPVEYDVS